MYEINMKKEMPKKTDQRPKGARKSKGAADEVPLEFDRGWAELEAQHARIKSDWMSLAAQIGLGEKKGG